MTTPRIQAAVNELAAAITEFIQGSGAGVSSSSPAPSAIRHDVCPVHGVEWRTTKGDGSPAKRAYCSQKNDDGSYCSEKGPWLQSR